MEEINPKQWKKDIKVLFDRVPQLKSLISNPVYYSNAPWAGKVNSHFLKINEGSAGEDFYRIVFKQGSPESLMTIRSGELAGKNTTCAIKDGRIAAVAGLERVNVSTANNGSS